MATDAGLPELIDEEVDQDLVLDSLRAFHREFVRREQAMVLLAVQWAKLNPGMERTGVDGAENSSDAGVDVEELLWEEIAAKGCPLVEDLAVPAFAEAAGLSEYQGRKLIRESLLLVCLLPQVWKRAQAGEIEVWRARRLAQDCWDLAPEAVEYVDRLMSLSNARHTQAGRQGVIEEARLRFMGEQVAAEQEAALEERCVQIATPAGEQEGNARSGGVVGLWGALDLPDALELEAAIARGAEALKDLGSTAPLDVRRSWALGDLARGSGRPVDGPRTLFDPTAGRDLDPGGRSFLSECACALGIAPPGRGNGESKVMMYLHLTPDALRTPVCDSASDEVPSGDDPPGGKVSSSRSEPPPGVSPLPPLASSSSGSSPRRAVPTGDEGVGDSQSAVVRVAGPGIGAGMAMSAELVRSWFTRPSLAGGAKIIFRPVVDLADHQHVGAYEVPDRLKEHSGLRDGTCVFPWCHRVAQRADCDHTIPWKPDGRGGPTCTCNLAPLCRFHHRAKTHADNHIGNVYTWWNYESLGEGKYLWKGPKGSRLLRTNQGVYKIDTSGAASESGHGEESIEQGVQAAQIVVNKITATLPAYLDNNDSDVDDGDVNEGGENAGERAGWTKNTADAGELAFPRPAPRARSWREMAPKIEFDHDPPNVIPGTLAHRVVNRELPLPTPLEEGLRNLRTEFELFATPQQRAKAKFHAEYHRRTGGILPRPALTTIGAVQFLNDSPWPTRLTPQPARPFKKRRTKWQPPIRPTEE